MDMMKEFLAIGKVVEKEAWTHIFNHKFSRRWCHNCLVAPARGFEVTRGVNQYFFCRICAFTARDAVALFYEKMRNKQTNSTGPK